MIRSSRDELLVVGIDIDTIERHDVGEPLAGLHKITRIDHAVGEHAVDRRPHLGEFEVAIGLGELRLQLDELLLRLDLLGLHDIDLGAGGVERG